MIYLDCRINELQGFPGGSVIKNPPAQEEAQKTWVRSLKQEDLLEEEMATLSIIAAWEIPWTEEPGGLQSWGHKESDTTLSTHKEGYLQPGFHKHSERSNVKQKNLLYEAIRKNFKN